MIPLHRRDLQRDMGAASIQSSIWAAFAAKLAAYYFPATMMPAGVGINPPILS
jgi:hypothetical protein